MRTEPGTPETSEDAGGGDEIAAVEHELAVLTRKLRSLAREFARLVHPELDPSAYGLLTRLIEVEHCRASDLACYFGVGKATMSRQLKVLEDLGLVRREPDPEDGRAWQLLPTEEGLRRCEQVRVTRQGEFRKRLGAWDRPELAELARLLAKLNRTGDA
ncbi:MarR family transcriptional regulator [Mangrovactinospora gilvigrisea]|uniref:MarR family transcriptional regulator n=1 Tax=Mangrovactinospora gilvigrisea TaxID=1428644 RepID=A0A1J7BBN5_9ACTN|nr:MarR family transcriptional regulator [Mangrovactinospora gilvigrisea]OIV36013.1 MarR family transcriptional regulator [Mangrovactinospora gilvigrisea]